MRGKREARRKGEQTRGGKGGRPERKERGETRKDRKEITERGTYTHSTIKLLIISIINTLVA
jgi:hypothetical protein